MSDIAVLTGGKFLVEELGIKLDAVLLGDLGRAERIIVDKGSPTIIDGAGAKMDIVARCKELRKQLEKTRLTTIPDIKEAAEPTPRGYEV